MMVSRDDIVVIGSGAFGTALQALRPRRTGAGDAAVPPAGGGGSLDR